MTRRGWAALAVACASIAGCGGWIDLESIAESHDSSPSAGADSKAVGAATGGRGDPTGGGGGAKLQQGGGAPSQSSAAEAGEASHGGVGLGSAGSDAAMGGKLPGAAGDPTPGSAGATEREPYTGMCARGDSLFGISGTIDGTAAYEAWSPWGMGWASRETHWMRAAGVFPHGLVYSVGGFGDLSHIGGQEPYPIPSVTPQALQLGVVALPDSDAGPGQVFCFGDGYSIDDPNVPYWLFTEHAKSLGTCPGVPVEGELTFCGSDPEGLCAQPVSGSLEGKSLPGDLLGAFISDDSTGAHMITGEAKYFMFQSYKSAGIESGTPGELDSGLLVVFPGTPGFEPSVYCVGEGSGYDFLPSGRMRNTFRNLSKLGECRANAGTDSIQVCY